MKILKNIFLLLLIATVASCESFTEFDRGFLLSEEGTIKTVDDLERLLLGTYDTSGTPYVNIISINSIASDEVRIGLGNRGGGLQAHAFNLNNTANEPLAIWNSAYNVIDNANRIIRAANNITVNPGEEARKDQIVGEALTLRAWQHFDLLRMFATNFDPQTAGVPIANRVIVFGEDGTTFPRETVGAVLNQINQDLLDASSLIPDTATDINRFNLNAVKALQARVGLYTGDNASLTNAVNLATDVLTNVPIITGQDYIDMFRDDPSDGNSATETLFQVQRDQLDGSVGTIYTSNNNDILFSASFDLASELVLSGATRSTVNLDFETIIDSRVISSLNDDELFVGKYLGSSEFTGLNNIKIFRSSEMLLIRAEANARLGFLTDARNDIVALRTDRASTVTTPAYADEDAALTDILAERRVELAFEGHRLLDLKRFNAAVNRSNADCSNPNRVAPTSCSLPANSFRFTLPIPQAEIFSNDGISNEDQNTGY